MKGWNAEGIKNLLLWFLVAVVNNVATVINLFGGALSVLKVLFGDTSIIGTVGTLPAVNYLSGGFLE